MEYQEYVVTAQDAPRPVVGIGAMTKTMTMTTETLEILQGIKAIIESAWVELLHPNPNTAMVVTTIGITEQVMAQYPQRAGVVSIDFDRNDTTGELSPRVVVGVAV